MNEKVISKEDTRRYFISVLRGIAIFLMLWGHCIQCCCYGTFDFFENDVFRVIYSFHMPLLMLISGYLFYFSFKKRTLAELIEHKTQAMLQPIIMCSFLFFILVPVVLDFLDGEYFVLLSGGWLSYLTKFWFLWSVLACSITVACVCKTVQNWVWRVVLLAIGVIFVRLFPCSEMNVFMYPYFVIGFLFPYFRHKIGKLVCLRFLSIPLFPVMMCFYHKEHYIYTSGLIGTDGLWKHMPVNIYRWAIGLVGSIFVICLLELVFRFVVPKLKYTPICNGLSNVGQKSLQIYVLSIIFLSQYLPIVYEKVATAFDLIFFPEKMFLYNYVFTFLLAIIYSFGLFWLVRLLDKTKVNLVLFGR